MLLAKIIESLIVRFTPDGDRTFFEPETFSWIRAIETASPQIKAELDALLARVDDIPNFQDISDNQQRIAQGNQWKTFFLWAYGKSIDENRVLCPQTDRALRSIPGMKTAMFSILAPGKHIPAHKGPYKGVLRYHLGLIVPRPESQCRIRVGSDVRSWREGGSLVFDDSFEHEVWNDANARRVVLFVDFLRPLPWPISWVNRFFVWVIAQTKYVSVGVGRARKAGRQWAEQA
jgi:ornithine lipid ester-linked acyl 2-hydroxylase